MFKSFDTFRMIMPKHTGQYITPKLAYMARTDSEIIIKVHRGDCIILKEDGTYTIVEHKNIK